MGESARVAALKPRRAPGIRRAPAPPTLSAAEIALVRSLAIHEDAAVLALNKPAGLSSQGGRGQANTLDELLFAFARSNGKRPVLVHRLDRDTSGVILAAKTQPAASFLGKALAARKFEKTYLALVGGGPPDPRDDVVEVPLKRVEQGREVWMRTAADDDPEAQPAVTRYRTLAATAGAALVEARPVTGRMHQIRVHLQSLGRPIAGDARYGGALALAGAAVPRLMLHASALSFPDPDRQMRTITAPPPEDFVALATHLGLGSALGDAMNGT